MILKFTLSILVIILLTGVYSAAVAQYTGGPGAGYASAIANKRETGLKPNRHIASLQVFPNPAKAGQTVHIVHQNLAPGNRLKLYSAEGLLVSEYIIDNQSFKIRSEIPPGLYTGLLSGSKGPIGRFKFMILNE